MGVGIIFCTFTTNAMCFVVYVYVEVHDVVEDPSWPHSENEDDQCKESSEEDDLNLGMTGGRVQRVVELLKGQGCFDRVVSVRQQSKVSESLRCHISIL